MNKKSIYRTTLIIVGILIAYIQQMAPSPILMAIQNEYQIFSSNSLLNLAVSVMYPTIIIASLVGTNIEKKIGTYSLYSLALALLFVSGVLHCLANSYFVLLLARVVYGAGFGLGIPFIGSAIMQWFSGKGRDTMNTVNGLFPFFGATISFCLMEPLRKLFGGQTKYALALTGLALGVILVLWVLGKKNLDEKSSEEAIIEESYNVYAKILKFKNIRLLCIIFMCDFFCYSYLSVVLPTMIFEASNGGMTETTAGLLAAVAFPVIGILGASFGGVVTSKFANRRRPIIIGQFLKFVSLIVVWFLRNSVAGIIAGSILFGFGNGFWMPAMYSMPMDMKELNAGDVGAVFAFVSSCGFVCGFISPIIGGMLTDKFITAPIFGMQPNTVTALALGLLIFNVVDLISVICGMALKEK